MCPNFAMGIARCASLPTRVPSTRSFGRVRAIRENPQNTENPLVVPEPSFDCAKAVQVQLESLQEPNSPWPNHGTQMMYNFAYDVGGLDPSMYFAYG